MIKINIAILFFHICVTLRLNYSFQDILTLNFYWISIVPLPSKSLQVTNILSLKYWSLVRKYFYAHVLQMFAISYSVCPW
jgi:hypothetical protein